MAKALIFNHFFSVILGIKQGPFLFLAFAVPLILLTVGFIEKLAMLLMLVKKRMRQEIILSRDRFWVISITKPFSIPMTKMSCGSPSTKKQSGLSQTYD